MDGRIGAVSSWNSIQSHYVSLLFPAGRSGNPVSQLALHYVSGTSVFVAILRSLEEDLGFALTWSLSLLFLAQHPCNFAMSLAEQVRRCRRPRRTLPASHETMQPERIFCHFADINGIIYIYTRLVPLLQLQHFLQLG